MSQRIVITGLGCVTPLGYDVETLWSSLLAGKAGAGPTRRFDAETFPTSFSSQVPADYDVNELLPEADRELHAGIGINTAFALGAMMQAWRQSELEAFGGLDRERLGIYLGSGEGSLDFDNYVAANLAGYDEENRELDAGEWIKVARERMSAQREIEQEPNMPLAHIAMQVQAQGPAYNCLTACAASTQAIGEATEILRRGDADVMIAGGAHSMIHPLGVTG
ncbi:MAG: beta-ketoacyl synthase N-terminal-like domain-containing protein, partial [Phycisphaeraceae bacterium]|nr:beta-ketoacyl synthase N-terminal-like domain-containing protein [Phycisphaeraceae bacterium]